MFTTTRRRVMQALGLGGAASLAGCTSSTSPSATEVDDAVRQAAQTRATDTVAADPTELPDPVDRDEPRTVEVELTIEEVVAQIEDGKTFRFLTYDGQVPGPMVRVRQGDRVRVTVENPPDSQMNHNTDFHAVYGTGGGSIATTAEPGGSNDERVRLEYPGAFIYHCAVPNLDQHISAGMFGMILVEPKEGLPEVDHEFYFGQHELYTDRAAGEEGHHGFDAGAMKAEDLLNGGKFAWAAANQGPLQAAVGESARVYMVTGGPNLSSNFHPIGNVWTEAYRDGAVASDPERYVQTMKVPPGSCMVGEMDLPVPERIKLVDHALSRVVRKGALAEIDVTGEERPEVFDPSPDTPAAKDEEGPIY